MLKNSSILRAVLGDQFRPSNEDSVTTEEVGRTADAVVEIERLKQENLDLMEIHALEQDLALIEQDGAALDELSEATDEITEMRAEIESYYEKGGMSASDAHHMSKRLEYINKRLGGLLTFNIPATESFRGNDADRMTLTASTENAFIEGLKKMWEGFKNMIKKIVDTVKGWFGVSSKKNEEVGESLKDTLEKVKTFDNVTFSNVASFKPIFGDAAWIKLGESGEINASGAVIALDDVIKNHQKVVQSVNELTKDIIEGSRNLYDKANGSKLSTEELLKITDSIKADGDVLGNSFSENKELSKMENETVIAVMDSVVCLGGKYLRYTTSINRSNGSVSMNMNTEVKKAPEGKSAGDVKVSDSDDGKKVNASDVESILKDAISANQTQQNAFNSSSSIADQVNKLISGIKVEQAGENLSDDDKKKFNVMINTVKTMTSFAAKAPIKAILADGVSLLNKMDSLIKAAAQSKESK